jgi:hypothetical protein
MSTLSSVPLTRVTAARFTVDGSEALESHLAKICDQLVGGIRGLIPTDRLEAVLLGGGYGRGEGGVFRTPDGDRPYNDLEFYVCLQGPRHLNELRHGRALHVLGEIMTPMAGVEVEFKITSLAELRAAEVTMFSYDLITGHRWCWGDPLALQHLAHHHAAEAIPLAEATRLLMNRCTGLLLAAERLQRREFSAAEGDFVARNIAKAELALGDAVLTVHREYHWSARERHRRLQQLRPSEILPWLEPVRAHHATGLQFKFLPERTTATRSELQSRHAAVTALARPVWLWLEQRRLGLRASTASYYALSQIDKCPETSGWRNLLINLRQTRFRHLTRRHPRERVLSALPLLLWDFPPPPFSTEWPTVQRLLDSRATEFAPLVAAYRRLWERVN